MFIFWHDWNLYIFHIDTDTFFYIPNWVSVRFKYIYKHNDVSIYRDHYILIGLRNFQVYKTNINLIFINCRKMQQKQINYIFCYDKSKNENVIEAG